MKASALIYVLIALSISCSCGQEEDLDAVNDDAVLEQSTNATSESDLQSSVNASELTKRNFITDFGVYMVLKPIQLSLRLFTRMGIPLTGQTSRDGINKAVTILPLPGTGLVANSIEFALETSHEAFKVLSGSQFMTDCSPDNLKGAILDVCIFVLEALKLLFDRILNSVVRIFTPTDEIKVKEIADQRAKISNTVLVSLHDNLAEGLETLVLVLEFLDSSREILEEDDVPLPAFDLIKRIMGSFLGMLIKFSNELLVSKFLSENPSWKNVMPFVVEVIRSVISSQIWFIQSSLQALLECFQSARGLPVEMKEDERELEATIPGAGILVINGFRDMVEVGEMYALAHKILLACSEFVHILFERSTVSTVFYVMPEFIQNAIFKVTDRIDSFALFIRDCEFLRAPTLDNLLGIIKGILLQIISFLEGLQTSLEAFQVTDSICFQILNMLVPQFVLKAIKVSVSNVLTTVEAFVEPRVAEEMQEFVEDHELLFGKQVLFIITGIMNFVYQVVKGILDTKFFVEEENAKNVVHTLHDLPIIVTSLLIQQLKTFLHAIAQEL